MSGFGVLPGGHYPPGQPHPVPVYGPPPSWMPSAAEAYAQARRSALLRVSIESVWTAEVSTSYGHIVLACDEFDPGQAPTDYRIPVWHAPAGALWLSVGSDTMHSLLTVKVLPIGLEPRDRPGTQVVYDAPVEVGRWGWADGDGYMPLHAGDGSAVPYGLQVPFCPKPAVEGWSARVQVIGREESRQLGDSWLGGIPDDEDGEDAPWPERPDPVEHWWVSFYRLTWPHSGTAHPGEEDVRVMVGSPSDYSDPEPTLLGYRMSDGSVPTISAHSPGAPPTSRADPSDP